MIISVQSVIEAAYGMIGVYDGSSSLTAWEYQTAQDVFNDMLDSWNNLNLLVYSSTAYTFPFQSGVQTYSVGSVNPFVFSIAGNVMTVVSGSPAVAPGNVLIAPEVPPNVAILASVGTNQYSLSWTAPLPINGVAGALCSSIMAPEGNLGYLWNIPRPTKIEKVSVLFPSLTSQPVEIAIPIIDLERWQNIPMKNTVSNYPTMVYNDCAFPFMNMNFWPIPSGGANAVIYAWEQITAGASLTSLMEVPQGYNDAFKSNLAIKLCPYFSKDPSSALVTMAIASRNAINNINAGIPSTHYDSAWNHRIGSNEALGSRGFVVF